MLERRESAKLGQPRIVPVAAGTSQTQSALPHQSASPPGRPRLLVADHDRNIVQLLSVSLGGNGFEVARASSAEGALAVAARFRPDAIDLDRETRYRRRATIPSTPRPHTHSLPQQPSRRRRAPTSVLSTARPDASFDTVHSSQPVPSRCCRAPGAARISRLTPSCSGSERRPLSATPRYSRRVTLTVSAWRRSTSQSQPARAAAL